MRRWEVVPEKLRILARILYLQGNSSREVAATLGLCKTSVARICKDIARSKTKAGFLARPAKSKRPRTCHAVARRHMEEFLGRKLKHIEHVHHVNGDYTDNRFENLSVVSAKEHRKIHARHKARCIHGHPLTGSNLYIRRRKSRGERQPCEEYVCRICSRAAARRYYYASARK